jgi:hypothetical protein
MIGCSFRAAIAQVREQHYRRDKRVKAVQKPDRPQRQIEHIEPVNRIA